MVDVGWLDTFGIPPIPIQSVHAGLHYAMARKNRAKTLRGPWPPPEPERFRHLLPLRSQLGGSPLVNQIMDSPGAHVPTPAGIDRETRDLRAPLVRTTSRGGVWRINTRRLGQNLEPKRISVTTVSRSQALKPLPKRIEEAMGRSGT